ncbi:50S ribosomal protein L32e [archaeon]|jgi:large subunit ribosomal protein L32e|nr:50S ribosomal protein L32e [archaeon]NHV06749.1 50S ribosomal protein L32e [Nitrososphaerota archaeon]
MEVIVLSSDTNLKEVKKKLKRLLKEKKKIPKFIRQESWRYARLKESWRRPKGIDNKVRLEVKGWPARVKIGYRSPKDIRGLHPSGLKPVLVQNKDQLSELEKIKEKVIVVISSKVGRKKKREITEMAKQLGLKVSNPYKEEVFE